MLQSKLFHATPRSSKNSKNSICLSVIRCLISTAFSCSQLIQRNSHPQSWISVTTRTKMMKTMITLVRAYSTYNGIKIHYSVVTHTQHNPLTITWNLKFDAFSCTDRDPDLDIFQPISPRTTQEPIKNHCEYSMKADCPIYQSDT